MLKTAFRRFRRGDRVTVKRWNPEETHFLDEPGSVAGIGPTGLIRVTLTSGETFGYEHDEITLVAASQDSGS